MGAEQVRRTARARARSWFEQTSRVRVSSSYDDRETSLSRDVCVEIGVALCSVEPRRVLDVGCGGGGGLHRLREALPDATLVGVDPSRGAIREARRRMANDADCLAICTSVEDLKVNHPDGGSREIGDFDLILIHLSLGLFDDPPSVLEALMSMLADGGRCYLVDLIRSDDWNGHDVPKTFNALHEEEHAYLRDQLAASYSFQELEELAARVAQSSGVCGQVRRGGLGGYPPNSPKGRALWAKAPRLGALLAGGGARAGAAGQMDDVVHLEFWRSE